MSLTTHHPQPTKSLALAVALSLSCLVPLTAQAFPSIKHPDGDAWATKADDHNDKVLFSNADNANSDLLGCFATACNQGFLTYFPGVCTQSGGGRFPSDAPGTISTLTFGTVPDTNCDGGNWVLFETANGFHFAVKYTGGIVDENNIQPCTATQYFDYATGCGAPPPPPVSASIDAPLWSLFAFLGLGGLAAWRFRTKKA